MKTCRVHPQKEALKVIVVYLIIGFLWIAFSDKLVSQLENKETIMFISMLKGWLYILGSGLFIYILLYYSWRRIEKQYFELQKSRESIEHLAFYDTLTDLPNRELFIEKLSNAVERAKQIKSNVIVLVLDFDNLNKINQTFGHIIADELIQQVSNKLKQLLKKNETLTRAASGKFLVLIEDEYHMENIVRFAETCRSVFVDSFRVEKYNHFISASIGISIYPDDSDNIYDLMRNADTAMYKAKEAGKNTFRFYHKDMMKDIIKKSEIERCLRNALNNHEFTLNYQPQIEAKTGRIRGCEALLRWESQELGKVAPLDFIPVAEETGLILQIGEWVLLTACRDNKEWQDKYGFLKIISVNISALQLRQKNFIEIVKKALNEAGMSPEYLELEVTESVLINSLDMAADIFEELTSMGVKIALDDFGTGYSSLNYLKRLPFNTLKIDKVFLQDIKAGSKEESISQSIIAFSHILGLDVIAEGVETKEQLEFLKKSNCDNLQGFLLYEPVKEYEIVTIIKNEVKNNNIAKYEPCEVLEKVWSSMPGIIGVYNTEHTVMFYNQDGYDFFNTTPDEVKNKKCYEMFSKKQQCRDCPVDQAISTKKIIRQERFISQLGKHVDCCCNPVLDESGEVLFVVEQIRDISDRRRLEVEQRENAENYQNIVNLFPYPIVITLIGKGTDNGRVVLANDQAIIMFNDSLVGQKIEEYIAPDIMVIMNKKAINLFKKRRSKTIFDIKHMNKDTSVIDLEITLSLITFHGKPAILSLARDISERKRELNTAANFQKEASKQIFPIPDKAEMKALYVPAKTVSGDFYFWYKVDDTLAVGIIGDVSGKGISAALSISAFYVLFREAVSVSHTPSEIIEILNIRVADYLGERYIAACCFSFDFTKNEARVVGAGINQFIFQSSTGEPVNRIVKGPFLGMFEDSSFDQQIIKFHLGDKFLFFTDGMDFIMFDQELYSTTKKISNTIDYVYNLNDILIDIVNTEELQDDCTLLTLEMK